MASLVGRGELLHQLDGGQGQVHRPVPLDATDTHPVTTPGGRYTDEIREQVHKDAALQRADPNFQALWTFTDAPPSKELQELLHEVGIVANWHP